MNVNAIVATILTAVSLGATAWGSFFDDEPPGLSCEPTTAALLARIEAEHPGARMMSSGPWGATGGSIDVYAGAQGGAVVILFDPEGPACIQHDLTTGPS
jgi:hypothetical protein